MHKKCAVISLAGTPNAGKSTLLNRLVGSKISIVSPKPQTTRACVRGIAISGATQLIFMDTPGIFTAKKKLDKRMVEEARESLSEADMTLLMVDASRGMTGEVNALLKGLSRSAGLVINKVDRVKKPALLSLTDALNRACSFDRTFMISALTGDGVEDLKSYLVAVAPEGEWLYPEDQVTDMPERLFAAEITRETLFMKLKEELPYGLMVETEKWEEKKGSVRIQQVITVERENHKKIILGKGGAGIKAIGESARQQLEKLLVRRVHLFLFVKVSEGWQDKREKY